MTLLLGATTALAARTAEEFSAKQDTVIVDEVRALGTKLPLWSGIPFVGILLSIALWPMVAPKFWHHHYGKIAIVWGLIFAVPFVIAFRGIAIHELAHVVLLDYVPFIILLWGLYTVSGGIYLSGGLVGRPMTNTTILLVGTLLASWMGTTGAAMLLIRPLIRANRMRSHKVHTIVFFIFLVANIGGLLTPLGDPPLFLGFLNGVPFFWTFSLWPKMAILMIFLLPLYYFIDRYLWRKESKAAPVETEVGEPLRINGGLNFVWLAGIIGAVLMSGLWHADHFNIGGIHLAYQSLLRDALIVLMGILSLKYTSKACRSGNEFGWEPIKEVALLFIGIFLTIVGPLKILQAGADGAAAGLFSVIGSPASYFWMSGTLSSFLDNAPTYLTFFNMSLGNLGIAPRDVHAILVGKLHHPQLALFIEDLVALSAGAVFFGANTYIGNAPNFMVRSIAENAGIKMPSFFGYMAWSSAILLPLFGLLTIIFFR